MAAPPDQPGGNGDGTEITPAGGGEFEVFAKMASAISELAEQERQRNANQLEIAMRGLEILEITEQREHDLSVKRLEASNVQHQRRYGLGRLIVIIAGVAIFVLLAMLGLVAAMAFWGDPEQSQTALTMLSYGFAAIGGGGILLLIALGINAVSKWWQGL